MSGAKMPLRTGRALRDEFDRVSEILVAVWQDRNARSAHCAGVQCRRTRQVMRIERGQGKRVKRSRRAGG